MSFRRLSVAAALVGVTAILGALLFAQGNSNPSIVGVWKVAERTYTGPNARKITSPQPGVRIFTQRHFSISEDTSDTLRELPVEGATDKQRADVSGPFTAQAGTYEIKGNEITQRRIAAKNPNNVRPEAFFINTFRFESKDTHLWLTEKANQNGPIANPIIRKLTRLE